MVERNMSAAGMCEAPCRPAGVEGHITRKKDRVGSWDISCLATGHVPTWSASGRRGAEADDARAREVGPSHSSYEADEQYGAIRCGAGGAKDWDQGECAPALPVPGSEPGKRASRRWSAYGRLAVDTRGGSRMRESRTYGSVRGASSNGGPYRDRRPWTKEDVRTLKTLAREKIKTASIARKLKRSVDATRQKASVLGVTLGGGRRRKETS